MSRRLPLAAVVVLLTTLLLAACGTGGTTVSPFEEIQDGPVTVQFDPSAENGTLQVDTTVPVVCAVVYGESQDFGLIATDDDMRGGAHADHAPRLTGLRPETEYAYRLQGTGADGTLYRSELMRFTTPAASETRSPGTNVAPDATVAGVSSEFSEQFAAVNAIDDDPGTEWATSGDGDEAFIALDLGSDVAVVAVGFRTRSMSDGSSIVESFAVTVDGDRRFGPFPVEDGRGLEEVMFTGRIVRFDVVDSTGGNTGAVEVEVYADRDGEERDDT